VSLHKRTSQLLITALGACLSLACQATPENPEPLQPETPLFLEIAKESGLTFRHFTGATGEYYLPEIMGAGVAVFDYDQDGDLDIYLLQGKMLNPGKTMDDALFPPPEENWPGARLFRNELRPSGELRFTDVTQQAGVSYRGYGMGAAVGDIDNDGDLDLYVTGFGGNTLYRNNGDGTFEDVTRRAGVNDPRWSMSAAFCDYDNDGRLDLYVTNYVDFTLTNNKLCHAPTGARDYCSPTIYRPVPDRLFHNEGQGRFRNVSEDAGLGAAYGNGLGVACADFNGDGWTDFYVANDGNANQLWLNHGDGTFEDAALFSGAAYNAHGRSEAGMGVTVGDPDQDGDEDIFVTHLAQETNTLYLNNGSGEFEDRTEQAGVGAASAPYTGFGTHWFDFDHDALLDLFVANGAVTKLPSQQGSPYPFAQKNQLFRGLSEGRFEEISQQAGPSFELEEVSRGAAFGDLDQDGDIDIAVSNNNGPARLLLNQAGSPRPWVQVKLVGEESNREGAGARVELLREQSPPFVRRVQRSGSYLSSSQIEAHFGLGENAAGRISGLAVTWPSGRSEVWEDVSVNRVITLQEGEGKPWKSDK